MSEGGANFEREVRDTIVKSGLTGVAATVLAVTIISPAGLGGMIGTSMANAGAADPSAAENPYADLPAYRSPLTAEEVTEIRGQLASTAASMEFTRAATEAKIDHVRQIAMNGAVTLAPLPNAHEPHIVAVAPVAPAPELRLTLTQPASVPAEEAAAPEVAPQPAAQFVQVSYSGTGGGSDYVVPYRDPHLELAELMFAHEEF